MMPSHPATLDGGRRSLDSSAIGELRSGLRGALLTADDDGYDDARRIWNAMIDKRPALIARCAGAADVMRAVRFAARHELLLSVKGGGHNVAGTAVCEGGLMIDLSRMKSVWVDAERRVARAEPGLLWQELDSETQAFGLATTGGVGGETGIAGLVLGGGGGNFGVVTSFELGLHEVGPVLGGLIVYPRAAAADVIRFHRDFVRAAPEDLTSYVGILTTPDGMPVVALASCYCGDLA